MSERNISNYQGCFQLVFKNIEQGTLLINIMFHYCPIKKGNSIFETVEL